MTTSVLKEFIDLAYTLNFSVSASHMFISQSTLSKHISDLEKELDTQLFIRSKQSVRLTESGRRFYEQIKPLMLQYEAAVRDLQKLQKTPAGSLRFGFAAPTGFIDSAVHNFRTKYPQVQLSILSDEIGSLVQGVKNDMLDICITTKFVNSSLSKDIIFQELFTDHLSVIMLKSNPLAAQPYLTFSELMDCPLSIPCERQFPDFYRLLQSQFTKSGKRPNIVCEFSHIQAAAVMAESGMAVSLLTDPRYSPSDQLVQVKLADPEAMISIGALWKNSNPAPSLLHFVDTLIESISENPPAESLCSV